MLGIYVAHLVEKRLSLSPSDSCSAVAKQTASSTTDVAMAIMTVVAVVMKTSGADDDDEGAPVDWRQRIWREKRRSENHRRRLVTFLLLNI